MSKDTKSRRSMVVNAVLVVVGFGLLGLAVWTNREKLREVFQRQVDFRLFGVAFAVYLTALVATFFRWYFLVRAVGLPFRVLDAIKLGFIGNVYNLVIPGAVGGDILKGVFLVRARPHAKASAIASMVIDRILGLAGLFLLAGVAGIFALGKANTQVKVLIGAVWLALVAGLTTLFILFSPQLYPLLDRLTRRRAKLAKVVKELGAAASAYRSKAWLVIACIVASSCIHSLYVVSFYAVSRAIFTNIPTFAEHFVIVPLVLFTTVVPLPFGALGLTENASGLLFGLGRANPKAAAANGAIAMMAFRTIMYAGGLVSLVVYLANLRWVRELTNPDDIDEIEDDDPFRALDPAHPREDPAPVEP